MLKVMFVCAGGMSTALTAKKLVEVAEKNQVKMEVIARGTTDFMVELQDHPYDIVLVAPQIRHRFKEVNAEVAKYEGVACEKIPPAMYAPMEQSVKKLFQFIMDALGK